MSNDAHLTHVSVIHAGYVDQFDAHVLQCDEHSIVIGPTPLIPDGPGKAGDRGTINGIGIQYVEEHPQGSRIGLRRTRNLHAGSVVRVVVDFPRRLALLRLASALLLLQWLIDQRWPACRVAAVETEPGFAWLTIEGQLDQPIEDLAAEANAHLASSRPINATRRNGIGLVEIPGLPVVPSSEQHVVKTREIGSIELSELAGTEAGQQCVLVRLLPPEELV